MRIVHIITGLGQGGAEAMLEKLVRTAKTESPEVAQTVVSLKDLGVVGPRLVQLGVPVVTLQLGGVSGTLAGLRRLFGLLRSLPRDSVVQTWLYHADLVGGVVARLAGRRRVFWNLRCIGRREDHGPATGLVLRANALLSRWVPQRIVSCGPAVCESHVRLGYRREPIVVVGNGFDFERFHADRGGRAATRAALGLAADDFVIGTVARVHAMKDYPTLAAAAARVVRDQPRARFLWVGEGVDSDAGLTALLGRLGLGDRIVRLGLRADIPDLLRALDAYCLPSRTEGFPNVLGEAMACGLPCVSTDAGDAAFLLGAREWIVPVQSPAQLADALTRLAGLSPDERRALGDANRRRVTARFSIRSVWRQYQAVYRGDDPAAAAG